MKSQLIPFESYITSLTELGVFPSFERDFNGWNCVLKNGANMQIMPFTKGERCSGETMFDALEIAVEGLNGRFSEPKDLHRYIETGIKEIDRASKSPHEIIENANSGSKAYEEQVTGNFFRRLRQSQNGQDNYFAK